MNRVVVTGIGVVSPIGSRHDKFWSALVEARFGSGRVVLFAFRPQFRGQPFATFKFLLNAVYLASARAL